MTSWWNSLFSSRSESRDFEPCDSKDGTDAEALEKCWKDMKREGLVGGQHGVLVFRKRIPLHWPDPNRESLIGGWDKYTAQGWAHVYKKDDPTKPMRSLTEKYKLRATEEMRRNRKDPNWKPKPGRKSPWDMPFHDVTYYSSDMVVPDTVLKVIGHTTWRSFLTIAESVGIKALVGELPTFQGETAVPSSRGTLDTPPESIASTTIRRDDSDLTVWELVPTGTLSGDGDEAVIGSDHGSAAFAALTVASEDNFAASDFSGPAHSHAQPSSSSTRAIRADGEVFIAEGNSRQICEVTVNTPAERQALLDFLR
jgi:hypothetical protein